MSPHLHAVSAAFLAFHTTARALMRTHALPHGMGAIWRANTQRCGSLGRNMKSLDLRKPGPTAHARLAEIRLWQSVEHAFSAFLAALHAHPILTSLSDQVRVDFLPGPDHHTNLTLHSLGPEDTYAHASPRRLTFPQVLCALQAAETTQGPSARHLVVKHCTHTPTTFAVCDAPYDTLTQVLRLCLSTPDMPPLEAWPHAATLRAGAFSNLPELDFPDLPAGTPQWGITADGHRFVGTVCAPDSHEAAIRFAHAFADRYASPSARIDYPSLRHHLGPDTTPDAFLAETDLLVWAIPKASNVSPLTRIP